MILSGLKVRELFNSGQWKAFSGERLLSGEELVVGEHSVDVRLDGIFICNIRPAAGFTCIDPENRDSLVYSRTVVDCHVVREGDFILGSTIERFDCSEPVLIPSLSSKPLHFTQRYDGRSTVGRLGISSHQTAAYVDYGFDGNITLEIANCNRLGPVELFAGMRIGQISFEAVCEHDSQVSYLQRGSYAAARSFDGPQPPAIGKGRF